MMKVFISDSSKDKKFVSKLKEDLNENDIQTWVDEDELHLGDTLIEKLGNPLEETSHCVIVLSQASINSCSVQFEREEASKLRTFKLSKKIIAAKYKECDVPQDITSTLYWDLSKNLICTF